MVFQAQSLRQVQKVRFYSLAYQIFIISVQMLSLSCFFFLRKKKKYTDFLQWATNALGWARD